MKTADLTPEWLQEASVVQLLEARDDVENELLRRYHLAPWYCRNCGVRLLSEDRPELCPECGSYTIRDQIPSTDDWMWDNWCSRAIEKELVEVPPVTKETET